jgi:DNA-binding GntR family transcriptional regulator
MRFVPRERNKEMPVLNSERKTTVKMRRGAPQSSRTKPYADSLSERVYQQIRVALMSGRYQPGEKLKLRDLALEHQVSLTPVREALKCLVSEKVLEQVDRRSVKLPTLSPERYLEICEMRVMLEGRAAQVCSQQISGEELTSLEAIHEELCIARQEGRAADVWNRNREFHMEICRIAKSPVLQSIVENLWLQSGPVICGLQVERSVFETKRHHPHKNILRAMRDRDAAEAARAMQQDIMSVAVKLIPYLRQLIQPN